MSCTNGLNNRIVEQLETKKEELVVSGGEPFSQVLLREVLLQEENSHIKSVYLSDYRTFRESMQNLEVLLEKCVSLTELRVIGSELSISGGFRGDPCDEEGLWHLVRGVAKSKSLEVLELSLKLTNEQADVLCKMLRDNNRSLRTLHVYSNLGDGAAKVLDAAVQEKRITHLRVQACNVAEETMKRMCAALKSNICLRSIDLSRSSFNEEGIRLLADTLSNDLVLEELSLDDCHLEDAGGFTKQLRVKESRSFGKLAIRSSREGAGRDAEEKLLPAKP